ncbi:hypothetical protein SteCoe_939 [Stentor coeruleus]|uniref:TLDc domain-containing protein n=1 Tax=Stentor coeruleus TaxID=5963 RepID=A0A1R2D343_9CILI|nr:hypothetical protein SteCoe_939 [Stentor coeruleus]
MGNCKGNSKSLTQERKNIALSSNWMKESGYLDRFIFSQKLDINNFEKLQFFLVCNCIDLELLRPHSKTPSYDRFFIEKFQEKLKRQYLHRGLPISKVSEFLQCIFSIDPANTMIADIRDYSELVKTGHLNEEKPHFGRQNISSNFLNTKGITAMYNALYTLHNEFPDIVYCPVLPRIVQVLLWFIPSNKAVIIMKLLINESLSSEKNAKIFVYTSSNKIKILLKLALEQMKGNYDKKAYKKLAMQTINEFLIGVIQHEYVYLLMIAYCLFGLEFIAKFVGFLLKGCDNLTNPTAEDLAEVCRKNDMVNVIYRLQNPKDYNQSSVLSSMSDISDLCFAVNPKFSRPSRIFTTEDQKNILFSLLPKAYSHGNIIHAFSIEYDGLLINEFNKAWHEESCSSLLVIKNWDVILGIFFDRGLNLIENTITESECFIFKIISEAEIYHHHKGQELVYEFDSKNGIIIGNKNDVAFKLDLSMLDAKFMPSNVFRNSLMMGEQDFQVHKLELYLLK